MKRESSQVYISSEHGDEENDGKSRQQSGVLNQEENHFCPGVLYVFSGNHVHFRKLYEKERERSVLTSWMSLTLSVK